MSAAKSKDEWEMGDIIDDLKAGMTKPGQDRRTLGTCPFHEPLARATLWNMRTLNDMWETQNGIPNQLKELDGKVERLLNHHGVSESKPNGTANIGVKRGKFGVYIKGIAQQNLVAIICVLAMGIMACVLVYVMRSTRPTAMAGLHSRTNSISTYEAFK